MEISIRLENDVWNVYSDGKFVCQCKTLFEAASEVDKIRRDNSMEVATTSD